MCWRGRKIKLFVLAKICQSLRDIGSMISRVIVSSSYPEDIRKICTYYFNLFALYFKENCNVTVSVWTMGYVIPYHVNKLYTEYKVGYDILNMQGKESKHLQLKQELRLCTNRSKSDDDKGKWYQIMRSSYVQTFYLPYHFLTSTCYSHYTCRVPKEDVDDFEIGSCSRKLNVGENVCSICANSEIIKAAENGEISENILHILKPIQCHECQLRFPDQIRCDGHIRTVHQRNITPCQNTYIKRS